MESDTPATRLLDQAKAAVTGPRQKEYGSPERNHGQIARLWQDYLRGRALTEDGTLNLTAADVAVMQILVKVARLTKTPGHADSWRDIAGYAACGAQSTEALCGVNAAKSAPGQGVGPA